MGRSIVKHIIGTYIGAIFLLAAFWNSHNIFSMNLMNYSHQNFCRFIYFRFFVFSFLVPSLVIFSPPCTWFEMMFMEYNMAAENRTQVLADTLWTDADAIIEITRQNNASGNFVWKLLPNTIFSKLPRPVSRNTNKIDPRNPPTMVAGWEAIRSGFAICIPLNNNTDTANDTTHEGLTASGILVNTFNGRIFLIMIWSSIIYRQFLLLSL